MVKFEISPMKNYFFLGVLKYFTVRFETADFELTKKYCLFCWYIYFLLIDEKKVIDSAKNNFPSLRAILRQSTAPGIKIKNIIKFKT